MSKSNKSTTENELQDMFNSFETLRKIVKQTKEQKTLCEKELDCCLKCLSDIIEPNKDYDVFQDMYNHICVRKTKIFFRKEFRVKLYSYKAYESKILNRTTGEVIRTEDIWRFIGVISIKEVIDLVGYQNIVTGIQNLLKNIGNKYNIVGIKN